MVYVGIGLAVGMCFGRGVFPVAMIAFGAGYYYNKHHYNKNYYRNYQ